jgi:hypothetical protein
MQNTLESTRVNFMRSLTRQLDRCSDKHDNCNNCDNLQHCRGLWDKLMENSGKPLNLSLLKKYMVEFKALRSKISERQPQQVMS